MPVVITPDLRAGSPWDAWEDRRHGPAETYPSRSQAALLRWEELLGQR